ncbi:MAG: hypothetical protein OXH71_04110 [Candidatus Dadabacteria bacterium]|nr:hypothetical protein [Candidatus Dadabacteria bacterium]MDE0519861.1 hypothetical protein [Candidatus Dadabacteria bacterium]MDE0663270.1 hypothetical protein [Candidatus Dadabacteria bacterium]
MRELTRCVKGVSLDELIKDLSRYITGWRGYFGYCEIPQETSAIFHQNHLLAYLLHQAWKNQNLSNRL